jgi:hypothetical protein
VACFILLHILPVQRIKRDSRPRAFANGQFMLFRRSWYDSIGGHVAVRQDLLEDLAFARELQRTDGRVEVLVADDMLKCSMYDSLERFTTGWRRIFIDVCGRRPRRLRKYGWRVLGAGLVLPLAQMVALAIGVSAIASGSWWIGAPLVAVVLAGLAVQAVALQAIYRAIGAPGWAVALFPAGAWIVGRCMLRGCADLRHRRPIAWGGREYVLEPRETSSAPWSLAVVTGGEEGIHHGGTEDTEGTERTNRRVPPALQSHTYRFPQCPPQCPLCLCGEADATSHQVIHANHIDSGASMPSSPRPSASTRPTMSESRRRDAVVAASPARSTGQCW